ncbi:serine hydrolase domain-containing protein [Alkalimonas amylolytica]|uniref:Beta-lactamase n=1 Tax=Alkalimonas amylolytica TaxID=152573 RepID=A0A1H3X396_ALKAM|nr:serine hydrolase [Alkalimonas amylolytica]SDZ93857.1 Beta-lactamase [Alkalimonas amylolytica]
MTKQFTATAIMLLVEQGKLSLSDTIDKFFPDVPADKKNITIHHLLTNSSGLPSEIHYYGYGWVISNPAEEFTSVWHDGSNSYSFATFHFYPDIDLFILTASNDRDNYPYPLMTEMRKSMQHMVAINSAEHCCVG